MGDITSTSFAAQQTDYIAELNQFVSDVNTNGASKSYVADQVTGAIQVGTSTTSLSIATGSKTFTLVETNARAWGVGSVVRASRTSDATKYMTGTVTAYAHPSITINMTTTSGAAGPYADWTLVTALDATGSYLALSGGTMAGELITAASASGNAGFNLPHGSAPSSPSNGDLWSTTSGIFGRVNGASWSLAAKNVANAWTGVQSGGYTALSDAATITWDMSVGNFFTITLGGNRTLGEPAGLVRGQSGQLDIHQDSTGSRTLAYAWPYVFAGGTAPTLSTDKYALDTLGYTVNFVSSGSVAITIASPAVLTWVANGMVSGQKIILTTTGALPTGLSVSTPYWVNVVSSGSGTFNLATSLANLQAGTYINTSGSQSGTHTASAKTITLFPSQAIA